MKNNIYPFIERFQGPELLIATHRKPHPHPVIEPDFSCFSHPAGDFKVVPCIDGVVHPCFDERLPVKCRIAPERVIQYCRIIANTAECVCKHQGDPVFYSCFNRVNRTEQLYYMTLRKVLFDDLKPVGGNNAVRIGGCDDLAPGTHDTVIPCATD